MTTTTARPTAPTDEASLDALLSEPAPGVGEALAAAGGDILLLGAGGKIGPSMALMARRALDDVGSSARVIAVSRFSDGAVRDRKSTRLNSSHVAISYAVFCLKT